ncbi:BREX-3 system phosphatase PglZ [Candidatus Methylacidiphilum infernorum]|uniref:PglZ domain containing protein, alkaline phosphatase family n=1 Tax=Methylacidiphilum infernorum (isolate V4) TaxID=481448 RepID=B3DYA3_METI4|nr:BREX-3 system phosphatase PglZ [Candidatus Methylacidiphilum infernorum]ACD82380.1 PglZ domain containing protein, alkaline phosphatase family [Methylacidiphilum infernorum V4]
MSSWRDQILSEFTPQVARLTLIADPDRLLLEEGILAGIRERGFELIPFEDHVAFRYAYESKFRSRWDRGEETDLVVVLRLESHDLNELPYDLLQAGRKLSFSLSDLFPTLDSSVVAALDRADLDALFDAQTKHAPGQLGVNATKDFVLRHVFGIAPELIKEPQDLLQVLLRRHYRGQRIPAILDERFIQVLRQNSLFEDWPLEDIIPEAKAFFAFLQERWPVFLDSYAKPKDDAVHEDAADYGFKFPGPPLLPFGHDDVRIYINNLFLEGLLQPVPHEQSQALAKTWVAYGIKVSPEENRRRRMEGLLDSIEKKIPTVEARHEEWLQFAYPWAELVSLEMQPDTTLQEEYRERLEGLRSRIDSALKDWVLKHYASLVNLPPVPPVMLHHIPRFLARRLADDRNSKIAFLLMDGLALDQWIALREVLKELDSKLLFDEKAVFAWIPTITSVSRQAAFAGKAPIYFPASIHTTEKEQELWTQFWIDQGLTQHEVTYAKGLGDGDLDKVSECLARPRLRVIGLVIGKVDRIMHGMELGAAGMHNQVRQWARQGFMWKLLGLLQTQGFQIYLASDHGNIESKGVGRPSEGAIADHRGVRVRIYSDPRLRDQVKERFPKSLEWSSVGLPEDYLALIAPNRAAFVPAGKTLVGHGGISVEELLVPFVQIYRRDG